MVWIKEIVSVTLPWNRVPTCVPTGGTCDAHTGEPMECWKDAQRPAHQVRGSIKTSTPGTEADAGREWGRGWEHSSGPHSCRVTPMPLHLQVVLLGRAELGTLACPSRVNFARDYSTPRLVTPGPYQWPEEETQGIQGLLRASGETPLGPKEEVLEETLNRATRHQKSGYLPKGYLEECPGRINRHYLWWKAWWYFQWFLFSFWCSLILFGFL